MESDEFARVFDAYVAPPAPWRGEVLRSGRLEFDAQSELPLAIPRSASL